MRFDQTNVNSNSLNYLLTWEGQDVTHDGFSIELAEIVRNGED